MSKSYNIAVIGGDGTGPEVTREAVKVLQASARKFNFKLNLTDYDFGGARYLKTGEVLPDSASDEMRKHDAILLGAIERLGKTSGGVRDITRAIEREISDGLIEARGKGATCVSLVDRGGRVAVVFGGGGTDGKASAEARVA